MSTAISIMIIFFLTLGCGGVEKQKGKKISSASKRVCTPTEESIWKETHEILATDLLKVDQEFRTKMKVAVNRFDIALLNSANDVLSDLILTQSNLSQRLDTYPFRCGLNKNQENMIDSNTVLEKLHAAQGKMNLMNIVSQTMMEQINETIESGLQKIPEIAARNNISVAQAKDFFAQKIIETYSL